MGGRLFENTVIREAQEAIEFMANVLESSTEYSDDLHRANERLAALIELGQQIAGERNPLFLLENFCDAARSIIGARYAAIAVSNDDGQGLQHFLTSGIEPDVALAIGTTPTGRGLMGYLLKRGGSLRIANISDHESSAGFPENHPKMTSFLGAAISSSGGIYGSLYLADKLDLAEFSEEDERLATMLAAQVGVAYENAKRYEEIERRAEELRQEVAERERAEEALRERTQQLQLALQVARMGVWYWNLQDDSVTTLQGSGPISGLPEGVSPKTGEEFYSLIHPDDLAMVAERVRLAVETEDLYQAEFRILEQDQTIRWVSVQGKCSRDAMGKPHIMLGVDLDITERKHAEEALRKSEARLREAQHSARIGSWRYHPDGTLTWSDEMYELFQLPRDVSPTHEAVVNVIHPDDRSGSYSTCLMNAINCGATEFEAEYRVVHPDGTILTVLSAGKINRDANGQVIDAVGIVQDITERKRLEEQFRHAQKMEAVGRLAGGVAHDFNNLLTAIIGYSQMALLRMGPDDKARREIQEIETAGQRAAALTGQLLAFSRKQVIQPTVLNLNIVVAELSRMLQRLIGEDIELVSDFDPELGFVKADRGQIEQIIMNLAVNARDAMPEGGKLIIETSNLELEEGDTAEGIALPTGSYVKLSISDTGVGMNPETKSRIFEPFFTTKEQGKGTGLGLSTVYGIVKQSGGHISVESEESNGTKFRLYLPKVNEGAERTMEDLRQTPAKGTETILLVEDEASVRKLAAMVLREIGYTVLEASGGEEALSLVSQYTGKIHLLLSDVVMPGMSGKELSERLKEQIPGMKVIFASGYTEDTILHHSVLDSEIEFIQKPFTPSSLSKKLRKVLGRTAPVSAHRL